MSPKPRARFRADDAAVTKSVVERRRRSDVHTLLTMGYWFEGIWYRRFLADPVRIVGKQKYGSKKFRILARCSRYDSAPKLLLRVHEVLTGCGWEQTERPDSENRVA